MVDFIRSQNLVIGATGSGKSTFIKKILKSAKFKVGVIVTTTPWEYTKVKSAFITSFDKIDLIVDLLFSASPRLPRYIVIDNYVGVYKLSDPIEKLFTQGRHFNIATFVLTQYAAKCPPVCRENARYIWVFRSCVKSYELIFNNQNKYAKKQDFIRFMQSRTGYTPILINNSDLSLKDNIILLS